MADLTLHFGVVDLPYSARARTARQRARAGTKTTGDVAEWLENRYHVMEVFYEEKAVEIEDDLSDGLQGAIESMLMGAPPQLAPFGSGIAKIEDRFKQFISTKEIERVGIAGVPTEAALRGVSHRFKRPYVRRAPRPSFIDTGLFVASFKAWID
jgi:hypothetical protein